MKIKVLFVEAISTERQADKQSLALAVEKSVNDFVAANPGIEVAGVFPVAGQLLVKEGGKAVILVNYKEAVKASKK